jgi:nickel-dependent lactate racemase
MLMRVELPYGREKRGLEVCDGRLLGVFSPKDCEPAKDARWEIVTSVKKPIGSSSLDSLLRPGKSVAIAVDDNTRVTPVRIVLSTLVEYFKLRRRDVRIIVALGTHRKMSEAEMVDKYGSEVVEEYDVINHAFDEPEQLKAVGKLPGNVPVWVNKDFLDADVKIGIGNIIPHFTAGWSAGSKILLPGLAGEETVGWMHYISAIELPNALGVPENSARMLMDKFAEQVGLDFVINTVLNRREEIVKVFSGHFVEAHRKGIEFAKEIYSVEIPFRSDITIVSSYPADIEFWQAEKGLYSADLSTRRGGGILLLTPCPEGISATHKEWADLLQYDSEAITELIKAGKVKDLTAASLALCVVKSREPYNVCVVSDGITEDAAQKLRFKKFKTLDEGLKYLDRLYGEKSRITILTHGGDTFPTLKTDTRLGHATVSL